MISRKAVLKTIRENVTINSWQTFSDKRANHQRVKFYGCRADVDAIEAVIADAGYKDVTVQAWNGSYVPCVVINFPYNIYN